MTPSKIDLSQHQKDKNILSKKETGTCKGIPYQDICENHYALALIQNKNFTKRQIETVIPIRDMQARLTHPTDDKFEWFLNSNSLGNCSVVANDTTNARSKFGPNLPGFWGVKQLDRGRKMLYRNIWRFHGIIKDCTISLLWLRIFYLWTYYHFWQQFESISDLVRLNISHPARLKN